MQISKTKMDSLDNFMKIFKYYKSNKPQPSLEHVISIDKGYRSSQVVNYNLSITDIDIDKRPEALGLQNPLNWNIVSFLKHPGLIFIQNPFTTLGQRYWIRKCLEEYTRKPNKLNIDNEIYLEDWWKQCIEEGESNGKLCKKLRWTTLGYHHNWDTKEYSEDNKNEFPCELAELCDVISNVLGFVHFKAEAAIVNYYHMGSTLSAHTDHSEVNLDAPLFSFSFGQSAIFLIGGKDKTIEPSPILLNSGDIVVMSKEARLCYHAVPRILKCNTQPWNDDCKLNLENQESIHLDEMLKNIEPETWSMFSKYVEESRININVRQVLNKDQKSLYDVIK